MQSRLCSLNCALFLRKAFEKMAALAKIGCVATWNFRVRLNPMGENSRCYEFLKYSPEL